MWNVYKEVRSNVEAVLKDKSDSNVQKLDASLQLHKGDFMDFLKNPVKNASDRAAVMAGVDKGLKTHRSSGVVFLTSDMTNEALTLSELFDLNEVIAVDLLLTAESEQYFYPGLSRGLIAVLIYFQSKLNLALSMQILLQGRNGRTWEVSESTPYLNTLLERFSSQLVDGGLVSKILSLLNLYNETNQLTRLQLPQFLAIGPPRHKFKVVELIRDLNSSLGSCLFYLSCQSSLSKADTLLLIGYLASIDQSDNPSCGLSNSHLAVLMSLLYSFDLKILEVQQDEDWTEKLSLLTDPSFHKEVTRILSSEPTPASSTLSSTLWTVPSLQGVVSLAWSVALMQLSNYQDTGDRAEWFMDRAIDNNAFFFIRTAILSNETFFLEQYYVRRMHHLINDLVVLMPLKVKEMRANSEEDVSNMDDVPSSSRAFQHLLSLIGALYKSDPLKLELSCELWCPSEAVDNQSAFNQSLRTSLMTQRRVTLFKFIRLAGDMLTPPLYTAYISMLTGLSTNQQSAHCCFNLLKLNAMTTGSQSSIVSWEHFFTSLDNYYTSLKHDDAQAQASNPPLNQTSPFHHTSTPFNQFSPHLPQSQPVPYDAHQTSHLSPVFTHRRNVISDQDVEGLISVLTLISTVVEKDQDARVALCESNRGQCLLTIFGLITCSIPMSLKAALLRCLSSFSTSANVAADVWLMMEKAQLLYMVGRNGSISPRGLHIEIDKMEPQTEEYSLTRSFIHLFSTLTSHPLSTPLTFGVQPFVNFLKDFIFLKAFSKSYKRPSEKWEVCALSLEVIHRLIEAYDVILHAPDDPTTTTSSSSPPSESSSLSDPRSQLLGLFYTENNFLKMVLSIIDQTSKTLNKHMPTEEKTWMDKASLWSLRLLHTALLKQASFLQVARNTGSLASTGTDKLLLEVNPRTLKSDHVINLSRFLMHSCHLPQHCLHVSHILSHLSASSYALPKIVALLYSNQNYRRELLAAVAECMDCGDAEVFAQEDQDQYSSNTDAHTGTDMDVSRVRVETRMVLMEMLLWSMTQASSHNMAYLLCGFDVFKPIHKTQIQDPGINHFPRTLLHSLTNHFIASETPLHFLRTSPSFSLMTYKFIYYLASDPQAHSPILRFLRSHDFLYKQAASFPRDAGPDGVFLPHLSWLLRTLVVDLKVSASNRQRSYVQKIVDLFVNPKDSLSDGTSTGSPDEDAANHFSSRIISTLRLIDLNPPAPAPCHLSIFHHDMVEKLVLTCEVPKEKGLRLVDLRLLYRHLLRQCNTLTASMASHKERALKDIELLCANVADRNRHKRALHASRNAFVSSKEFIEVALTACASDIMSDEDRQLLIVALLQTLLHMVSTNKPAAELAPSISELILILCCQLDRSFHLHSSLQPPIHTSSIHLSQDASILSTRTETTQTKNILSSSLQSILASILNYLLSSAPSHFRVRTYLYGAVRNCLNIACKPSSARHCMTESMDEKMQKYLLERDESQELLSRQTMATVSMVAPQLLSVLCKDSCDGHDISKMLSMTVLDCMLVSDSDHTWLEDMASKGFIQHLVVSLLEDSTSLEAIINRADASSLRALFIFQSKIALLGRIARTAHGANLLFSHDLMSVLSQCSVVDAKLTICNANRPPIEGQFVPSMLSNYRQQILFPVLSLTSSLLTALGPHNVMAIEKIFPFVMSHYELLVSTLSDHHVPLSIEGLQELQLVSALVSKTALDVAIEGSLFMDAIYGEVKVCTNKLQRLMAALLGRFSLGEVRRGGLVRRVALDSLKEAGVVAIGCGDVASTGKGATRLASAETKVMILVEEILCNSLSLSQSIISKTNPRNVAVSVLFAPNISDAIIQQNRTDNDYNLPSHSAPQSLGVLVQLLMDACSVYTRTHKHQQDTLHRHMHVSELSVEEVKERLEDEAWTEKLPLPQRHSLLRHKLLLQLQDKSKELKLLRYIIENSLLLLWRHLEFYLVKCQSAESALLQSKYKYAPNDSSINSTAGVDGLMAGGGVPREHLNVLKRDCIAWINEAFFKPLIDVEATQRRKDDFIGALVRKIKWVVTYNTSQK